MYAWVKGASHQGMWQQGAPPLAIADVPGGGPHEGPLQGVMKAVRVALQEVALQWTADQVL